LLKLLNGQINFTTYPNQNMQEFTYAFDIASNDSLSLLRQQTTILLSEIILLQAEVNYTHFFLKNGQKLTFAKTLKRFEQELDSKQFIRIHRTYLINKNHLKTYDSFLGEVVLTNNHRVSPSRRRKETFELQINCSI
jgi:DNA-binding LytR/AlgR family response regulator